MIKLNHSMAKISSLVDQKYSIQVINIFLHEVRSVVAETHLSTEYIFQ